MSKIKSKDTKPELLVRKYLFKIGFRFRVHVKDLPGKPDIVLPKYRTVIFVHGCFWHGHNGCKYFVVPKTRRTWWEQKIQKTKENDVKHRCLLEEAGWLVRIIWECDLKANKQKFTLESVAKELRSSMPK